MIILYICNSFPLNFCEKFLSVKALSYFDTPFQYRMVKFCTIDIQRRTNWRRFNLYWNSPFFQAFEAGSHLMSCCLWKIFGNRVKWPRGCWPAAAAGRTSRTISSSLLHIFCYHLENSYFWRVTSVIVNAIVFFFVYHQHVATCK